MLVTRVHTQPGHFAAEVSDYRRNWPGEQQTGRLSGRFAPRLVRPRFRPVGTDHGTQAQDIHRGRCSFPGVSVRRDCGPLLIGGCHSRHAVAKRQEGHHAGSWTGPDTRVR